MYFILFFLAQRVDEFHGTSPLFFCPVKDCRKQSIFCGGKPWSLLMSKNEVIWLFSVLLSLRYSFLKQFWQATWLTATIIQALPNGISAFYFSKKPRRFYFFKKEKQCPSFLLKEKTKTRPTRVYQSADRQAEKRRTSFFRGGVMLFLKRHQKAKTHKDTTNELNSTERR